MRKFILAISLCLSTVSTAFANADAGVMPVKATNLTEGEAAAIGSLITTAYSSKTKQQVLDPSETSDAFIKANGSSKDAAQALGLHEYIEVSAVRLNQRITISAALFNQYGSQLYQVRTTATSLDDMEPVSDRIADSLHRRTPLEYTQNLDNITGVETRKKNRMFVEKVIGVRTAVVMPFVLGREAPSPTLLLEFDSRLEGRSYFLEFGAGFMIPSTERSDNTSSIGALLANIGGSYYLGDGSVSPYIGGGVSPRLMFGSFSGVTMTANAHIGLMFMRESSSRIYTELQLDQYFVPLSIGGVELYDPQTGQYSTSHVSKVFPTEVSLAVGIGW